MLAVVVLAGCSGAAGGPAGATVIPTWHVGSGNLITREVFVDGFSEIQVGGALQADIWRGDSFKVVVTADDNVIDFVTVTKSDNTLVLGVVPGSYDNVGRKVTLVMPDITRLHLVGASRATISGFKPRSVYVELSGASQLIGRLEAGLIDLSVGGASVADLGGAADTLIVSGGGAGQIKLGDLSVGSGRVSLKEASTAIVNVRGRLDADVRSASNLYYVGNPALGSVSSVEGSSVRRR